MFSVAELECGDSMSVGHQNLLFFCVLPYWYFTVLACHSFRIPYRSDDLKIFIRMMTNFVVSFLPALLRSYFITSKLKSHHIFQIAYTLCLPCENVLQLGLKFHSLRWPCPSYSISCYLWSLSGKDLRENSNCPIDVHGETPQIGMAMALLFSHVLYSI